MEKTLFTKIIDGEVPGDFVYEDEHCVAIKDIQPAAPVHVLLIPRKPLPSLGALEDEDKELAGHLLLTIPRLAEQLGLSGYRMIVNTGEDGGQTVPHLHFHILGGRPMTEAMVP